MSKDKLILVEDEAQRWLIGWWIAEEAEVGALLGDRSFDKEDLKSIDPEAFEAAAAHFECIEAAKATGATKRSPRDPWIWESKGKAQAALSMIKAGMTARRKNRPMPEWAKTAIANGWKPPKGWTP